MLVEVVMLLATALPGQYGYVNPPIAQYGHVSPPMVVNSNTGSHLLNTGIVRSKCYVWVQLPNGHRTRIPVINGYLPQISYSINSCGQITRLSCDYAHGRRKSYSDFRGQNVIRYVHISGWGASNKAPTPQHPDKRRGVGGKTPKTPQSPAKAPAPQQPFKRRGVSGNRKVPAPQLLNKRGVIESKKNSKIDKILERVKIIEKRLEPVKPLSSNDMRRPSDITHPENERTKSFPRYQM